jgi:hypothetical protein
MFSPVTNVAFSIVVVLGVLGERLGNENPCVINQQVDTTEMLDCGFRYFDRGFLLADFIIDEDEIGRRFELLRLANSPRSSDDAVAAFNQRLSKAEAYSTGRAGDDGNGLLGCLHDGS